MQHVQVVMQTNVALLEYMCLAGDRVALEASTQTHWVPTLSPSPFIHHPSSFTRDPLPFILPPSSSIMILQTLYPKPQTTNHNHKPQTEAMNILKHYSKKLFQRAS